MGQAGHASGGSSHRVPLPAAIASYNFPSPPAPPKTGGRSSKGQSSSQRLLEWVTLSLSWVIGYEPLLAK